jgi:ketosteroid isomerase-like protein
LKRKRKAQSPEMGIPLLVWKKQADGSWKTAADTDNTDK